MRQQASADAIIASKAYMYILSYKFLSDKFQDHNMTLLQACLKQPQLLQKLPNVAAGLSHENVARPCKDVKS